jgi:DNA-binding LacI/PurR family transcriptional regulator/biotin operon repressor
MKNLTILSASEQVAAHLQRELAARTWRKWLPGERKLANELSVGRDTMTAALQQLEKEGWLVAEGHGKRRRIVVPKKIASPALQVRILLYEPMGASLDYLMHLRHELQICGHRVSYASRTLSEMHHDPGRVARLVRKDPADAWIVVAGGKPILEWFVQSSIPTFALFGRRAQLPIAGAGPDKAPAYRQLANRLVDLGHRNIVMLVNRERREPNLGSTEKLFLNELKIRGLRTGPYNVPDWGDSPQGFHRCLDSLFEVTPPTAFYFATPALFHSAQYHLAVHRRIDLRQISLTCGGYDPLFKWHAHSIAHFRYDLEPTVRRIVRWVNKVGRGEPDRRQTLTPVQFIEGDTIRPVPE